jgi:S1-C subfamily serine protease
MRKVSLYSSSSRSRSPGRPIPGTDSGDRSPEVQQPAPQTAPSASSEAGQHPRSWWRRRYERHERFLLLIAGGLFGALALWAYGSFTPPPRQITQEDIDAAVLRTMETHPLPSPAVKAYETIRPSVVRVRGLGPDEDGGEDVEKGIGSGVVIVDKGIILTNLHVVAGASRIQILFADGLESEASVIALQPENDLAVLQAKTIPDDLGAATLRSTRDLAVGDHVVAVGFPFGIGPSVSAGVVSGLRREFRSPEGKRVLTNLIQFDAAANPGSSGGPLVTAEGEVVGIVTAILNPTEQRFFVGIGFAVPIETAAGAAGVPPF